MSEIRRLRFSTPAYSRWCELFGFVGFTFTVGMTVLWYGVLVSWALKVFCFTVAVLQCAPS